MDRRYTGTLEVTWERFGQLCRELALAVASFDPEVIIGIAKGGVFPAAAISSMLRREFYPIRLSRRYNDRIVREQPVVLTGMPDVVSHRRVLIVDDIALTGQTLRMAAEQAELLGAKAVKTAALFVHSYSFKPDYFALESDAFILHPWDYLVLEGGQFVVHPEYEQKLRELG